MNRRAFLLTSTAIVLIVAAVGGVATTAYFLRTTATGHEITDRITTASQEVDLFSEFRGALENVAGIEVAGQVLKIPPPPNVAKCVFDREIAGQGFSSKLLPNQKASLYFGPFNNLHIIWLEQGREGVDGVTRHPVYYSLLDNTQNPGDSLITKMRINQGLFSAPYTPAMAVDMLARMHVISTDPGSTDEIYYTQVSAINAAETKVEIEPKMIIDFGDPNNDYYTIAARSDRFSNLHLLLMKVEKGSTQPGSTQPKAIYYKKLGSNMTTWTDSNGLQIANPNFVGPLTFETEHTIAEVASTSDPRKISLPDMEIDYYGKAYIIWREKADAGDVSSSEYFVFSKVSSDGTLEIDKKEIRLPVLEERKYLARYVDLYLDKKNTMHLVWDDDTIGTTGVYYMRLDQAGTPTLNNPKPVSRQGTTAMNPVVAASEEVFVFWDGDPLGARKLSYARLDDWGTSIVSATPMSTIYGKASLPTLSARASYHGKAHLTWMDGNSLYYARSCDVVSPPEIIITSPKSQVTATKQDYAIISGKILDNTGISLAEIQHPKDFCKPNPEEGPETVTTRLFVHLNGSFSHRVEGLCSGFKNRISINARDTDGNIASVGLVISNVRSVESGDTVYPGETVDISSAFPVAKTEAIILSNKRQDGNPGSSHITDTTAFSFMVPYETMPDTYYLLDKDLYLSTQYIIIEAPDAGSLKGYLGDVAGNPEDDISNDKYRGLTLPLKGRSITLALAGSNIDNKAFPSAKALFEVSYGGTTDYYEAELIRGQESHITISKFAGSFADYTVSAKISGLPPSMLPDNEDTLPGPELLFTGDSRLDTTIKIEESSNAGMCEHTGCYFQGEDISITAFGPPYAEYSIKLTHLAQVGISGIAAPSQTNSEGAIDGDSSTYAIFTGDIELTMDSPHLINKLKLISNIENPTILTSMDGETWTPITKTDEILSTMLTPYYPPAPDTVALWRFDAGEGTTAVDLVGDNDGTINGDPQWVDGKHGKALEFDGTGDYIDFEESPAIENEITVQAWVKWADLTGTQGIVSKSKWNDGSIQGYLLRLHNDGLQFNIGDAGSGNYKTAAYPTSNLETDRWYHIAGTYDGATIRLYVDGAEVQSVAHGVFGVSTNSLSVGSSPVNAPGYFKGTIDDVRIRNIALRPTSFDRTVLFTPVMAQYVKIESIDEGNLQVFEVEPIPPGDYPSTTYTTGDGEPWNYEEKATVENAPESGIFSSKLKTYVNLEISPPTSGLNEISTEYKIGEYFAEVTSSSGASAEKKFFIEPGIGLESEKLSDDAIFVSWNPIEYVVGANSQAYSLFGQKYLIYRNVEECLDTTLSEDCRLPTYTLATGDFTIQRDGTAYSAPLCSAPGTPYTFDMDVENSLRIGCVDTGLEPVTAYTYSISTGDRLTESNANEWGTPVAAVTLVEDSFLGARRGSSYIRGIVKAGSGASIEYPAAGGANWNLLSPEMDKLVFDMKVDDLSKDWKVTIYDSDSSYSFMVDPKDDLWHNYVFSLSEAHADANIDTAAITKIAFGSDDAFLDKSTSFGIDGLYFADAYSSRYFFSSSAEEETYPTVTTPTGINLGRAEPGCSLKLSWNYQSAVESYTIKKYELDASGALQLIPTFSPAVLGATSLYIDEIPLPTPPGSPCGEAFAYEISATRDYYTKTDTSFSGPISAIARPEAIKPKITIKTPKSGAIFSSDDTDFDVAADLSDSNNVTNYTVFIGQGNSYLPVCSGAIGSTTEEDYNKHSGSIAPCPVNIDTYLEFGQNNIRVDAKDRYNNQDWEIIQVEYAPVTITMDEEVEIPEVTVELLNEEEINSLEIYCNDLITPYVVLYALSIEQSVPYEFVLSECINPGANTIRTVLRVGDQALVESLLPGQDDPGVQSITIDRVVEYIPFDVTPLPSPIGTETIMIEGTITAYEFDQKLKDATIMVDVITDVGGTARIETFSTKLREYSTTPATADYKLPVTLSPGPNTIDVTLKTTASKTSTIRVEDVVFVHIPIAITDPTVTVQIGSFDAYENTVRIGDATTLDFQTTLPFDIDQDTLDKTRSVALSFRAKLDDVGVCGIGSKITNISYHTNQTFWDVNPAGNPANPEGEVALRIAGFPEFPNYALKQFYVDEEVYPLLSSAEIRLFGGAAAGCEEDSEYVTHYMIVNGNPIELSCADFPLPPNAFDWVTFQVDTTYLWPGYNTVEVRATEYENIGENYIILGINKSTQNTSEIFEVFHIDDAEEPESAQIEGELMAALVIEYEISQNSHMIRINEETLDVLAASTHPRTITGDAGTLQNIDKIEIATNLDQELVAEFNLGGMKLTESAKAKIYVFGERFDQFSFCFFNPPEDTTYIEINDKADQRIYLSPCDGTIFPTAWSITEGWAEFEIPANLLNAEYNKVEIGSLEPEPLFLTTTGIYFGAYADVPLVYLEIDSPMMTTIPFDACDTEPGLTDTGLTTISFDVHPGAFRAADNTVGIETVGSETGYAPVLNVKRDMTGGEISVVLDLETVQEDRTVTEARPTIHGIVTDPDFIGPLEIKLDPALDFDGSGDYVDVPGPVTIVTPAGEQAGGMTFSFWLKGDYVLDYKRYTVVFQDNPGYSLSSGYQTSVAIRKDGKNLQYSYIYLSGLSRYVQSLTLGLGLPLFNSADFGSLRHYAIVVDFSQGHTVRLYSNGILIQEKSIYSTFLPMLKEGNTIAIGKEVGTGSSTTEYFDGVLDDVRIYSVALTDNDIGAIYMGGSPEEESLIGHWNFNEGEGSVAHDVSGNNYLGTLMGDPTWTRLPPTDGIINTRGDGTFTYTFYNALNCGRNLISIKPLSPKVSAGQLPKTIILYRDCS